jgi:2'-5' RNA ligase
MMIAFMLDPATAEQLALPGGEDPADLHVTLAYLGDMASVAPDKKLHPVDTQDNLASVLRAYAASASPLQGGTGGIARFVNPGSDKHPVVATVNVPGLQEWRRRLVNVLDSSYWIANDFDYLPHITLKYIDPDDPMPLDSIENVPLQFNELCLCIGDKRQHFTIGNTNAGIEYGQDAENRTQISEQARRTELKRWRTCALHDAERGRSTRTFESDILPMGTRTQIQTALERCSTSEHIKEIFRVAQSDPDFNWQDTDPDIQKAMAAMRSKGVKAQKWKVTLGACPDCMDNADKVVPLGQRFPTGVYTIPNHNHCECQIEEIYE